MKKILIGLTLLASMSSFAKVDFDTYRYKVEANSNDSRVKNTFDVIVSKIKSLEDCKRVSNDILDTGESILSDDIRMNTVEISTLEMREELNQKAFRLHDFLISYAIDAPSQCDEIKKILATFSDDFTKNYNH